MSVSALVEAGDLDGIERERVDTVSRFLNGPVGAEATVAFCRRLGEFHATNGVLAFRILRDGRRSVPPAAGNGPLERYLVNLAYAFPHELERPEAALAAPFEVLAAVAPVLMISPPFFPRAGDVERNFEHIEWLFERLGERLTGREGDPVARKALEAVVNACNLIPLYFADRSMLKVARRRAELTEALLRSYGLALDLPPRPPDVGRRRRIGVFREVYNLGSELAALRAHILPYDRERYEIILYGSKSVGDETERRLRDEVDHVVLMPGVAPLSLVERIRADGIDLMLWGQNICADNNLAWILATHRLAPIQVGFTLFPSTCGLGSFDYHVSGDLNETPSAADQYTEKLILLKGSINGYDFGSGGGDPVRVSLRAKMGLGADVPVFASGANLHKMTPELLATWARVLGRVPNSRLVLYPFNRNWGGSYPAKLFALHARSVLRDAGIDPTRLITLNPFADRREVLGLLDEADVYLDSFPFTGAVSIVDPLSRDLPTVALRGRTARCRQSAGFLDGLGLGEFVVDTVDAYVDLAARLGSDARFRAAARERIRTAKPPTFPVDPTLPRRFWNAVDAMFAEREGHTLGDSRPS